MHVRIEVEFKSLTSNDNERVVYQIDPAQLDETSWAALYTPVREALDTLVGRTTRSPGQLPFIPGTD